MRLYRQKSRMAGVIGSPLMFWFLIGSGLSNSFRHPAAPPDMSYLEYFFPGTIVLIILFTAIFSTISIIEDRKEGFLQSVIVSPAPRSGIVLGKLLGGTVVCLAQSAMLLLLTPFLGMSLGLVSLAEVTAALFLLSFGLTGLGFLIAWRMESTQGFHAIMNLFLIPLWMLSGALFPSSGAPAWLRAVMAANPLSYALAALRHGLYLDARVPMTGFAPPGISFTVIVLFAALCFFASTAAVARTGRQ